MTTEVNSLEMHNEMVDEVVPEEQVKLFDAVEDKPPIFLEFTWSRRKIFDEHVSTVLLEKIKEVVECEVVHITSSKK